jgi:clan AA aspartic protease (TIGR02281 family)
MWLSLAANNKVNLPKTQIEVMDARDGLARRMTQAQVEEAQKLARQCLQSDYRDCDRVTVVAGRENTRDAPSATSSGGLSTRVQLKKEHGGTFLVPVLINDAIELDFMIDTGASDVTIPADVFSTLVRKGTIKDSDITGTKKYGLADGKTVELPTFTIRSLKVGDKVVANVGGSVASAEGSLLLGQSFLEHFKSFSFDNAKVELLLEPQ